MIEQTLNGNREKYKYFKGNLQVNLQIRGIMHSIAFKLGSNITIYWYGIMVALGFVCAVSMLMFNRKHAKLDSEQISDIALYGMISGIVGARIFYVVQFWDQYRTNLLEIVRIDHGGLVFYGGFICAVSVVIVYCRRKKLAVLNVFDVFGPAMAIGHAFGRIGCFLNGCCYGKPSDIFCAVRFPEGSAPSMAFPGRNVHPVQIYEAIFNIVLAAVLMLLLRKAKLKPGMIASIYLIAYGVARFLFEFLRGDHKDFVFSRLTPSQSICLIVASVGIALLFYCSKRTK
jgi:phosphatidylglycerol:prolipoprotein diacylglycerol transferase